ncbi:hypothetical protein KIH74_35365 [Kineosporia sp. J2-2]|uniref:Uncharacterized protein n=1 Tax=Kineosporia corallincola TaxID=2835133 RepID=A0ABS5TU08_9ACTN|nr:hypothetical protein [Kineosporia corallincola]MBT0774277.1 hypothetical protein [Kineosporia corallincola]
MPIVDTYWAPETEENEAVAVDPLLLARQAKASMKAPVPGLARSPAGVAWVNEYTWFWLGEQEPLEATAREGAVWARVTAAPAELVVSGSAGEARCPVPGRAWTAADGGRKPGDDVCALVFRSSGSAVVLDVSVVYDVSWTSSTGAGGGLGQLTGEGAESVEVRESGTVVRS